MATQKRKTRSNPVPEVNFLNVKLSDSDKEAIHAANPSPGDQLTDLVRIVESGHKVSFTYVDARNNVTCSITSQPAGNPPVRTVVSSYGPDVETAFKVACYKFFVVTQGGDWSLADVWTDENQIG